MKSIALLMATLISSAFHPWVIQQSPVEAPKTNLMSITLDSQGTKVAVFRSDRKLQLWDVASKTMVREFNGRPSIAMTLAFSPDGKLFAAGSLTDGIMLFDVMTGRNVGGLPPDMESPSSALEFSPDSKLLAEGRLDGTIVLWDLSSQHEVQRLKGHQQNLSTLAFAPNNKLLASGSWDKTVRIWEISSGKSLATLTGHVGWVTSVAFSRDSKRLASSSQDGIVNIWASDTGKNILSMANTVPGLGATSTISKVLFTPDDASLLGLSLASCVVWDANTGKTIREIGDLPVGSRYMALTKDQRLVVVSPPPLGQVLSQVFLTGQQKIEFSPAPTS
jgi:WD40 repeat protein